MPEMGKMKYPEEKRSDEKQMAKAMMHKDSPVPPRKSKEMRKMAAKKKLQKKMKY